MVNFGITTLPAAMVVLNALITGVAAGVDASSSGWKKEWQSEFSGAKFENTKDVKDHIANACHGYAGHRGHYQDVYYHPWSKTKSTNKLCVTMGNNRVNFEIGNLNPNVGIKLLNTDCAARLSELVDMYPKYGGEFQRSGWYFRVDPNSGKCK